MKLKKVHGTPGANPTSVRSALLLLSAVVVLVSCIPTMLVAGGADKSFYHPLVEMRIELNSDGSADIEETRSFRFKGRFSWAELERNIRGQYGQYDIEYLGVEDADSGERLDTEMSSTGYSRKVKWYYSAHDETRRFRIRYRVGRAIQRYSDAAQFYFKVITDSHEHIDMVRVSLIPPAPSSSLFKVFVHSKARPGTLDIADDRSSATVNQSSIQRDSFVEIRALLDPAIFYGAPVLPGESHETLLDDERRVTEEWRLAEARRIESYRARQSRLKKSLVVGPVFLILFVIVYIMIFRKYGKEPDTGYIGIYEREIPLDIRPCVLPAILSQSGIRIAEMSKGFSATLLEAARLGYLEISEREEKILMFKNRLLVYTLTEKGVKLLSAGKSLAVKGDSGLIGFEFDVLETVIREAGDGREATSKDIEEWAKKTSGSKTTYYKFIEKKAKELRKDFEREHFRLDDPVSEKARKGFVFFSIAAGAVFAAAAFLITKHPVYFLFGALTMITGVVLSIPLARRSREAALNHQKWKAFRKFIMDFSAMKDAGPLLLPLWDHYLVFAVALGVADKFLSNLKLLAARSGGVIPAAVWFRPLSVQGGMNAGGLDGLASIESLSASIANLNSVSAALSSSSSGGGGFSGGGGGGGGGGGCGAG